MYDHISENQMGSLVFIECMAIGTSLCSALAMHTNLMFYSFSFCLLAYISLVLAEQLIYGIKNDEERERLNVKIHRRCAIVVNSAMGVSAIVVMAPHYEAYFTLVTLWMIFLVSYVASYLLRIIRPHSTLARFRSVLARVLIAVTIAGVIHPLGYVFIIFLSGVYVNWSWKTLRDQEKKFGWEFR